MPARHCGVECRFARLPARPPPSLLLPASLPCRDWKRLDTPDEQRFDAITALLSDMFQVGGAGQADQAPVRTRCVG